MDGRQSVRTICGIDFVNNYLYCETGRVTSKYASKNWFEAVPAPLPFPFQLPFQRQCQHPPVFDRDVGVHGCNFARGPLLRKRDSVGLGTTGRLFVNS
jgi:hypothetical protein